MVNKNAVRPDWHSNSNFEHIASFTLLVKNGSQQIRKTPMNEKKKKNEYLLNRNAEAVAFTSSDIFHFPSQLKIDLEFI